MGLFEGYYYATTGVKTVPASKTLRWHGSPAQALLGASLGFKSQFFYL